jgi:hypothetical protein
VGKGIEEGRRKEMIGTELGGNTVRDERRNENGRNRSEEEESIVYNI